MTTPIASGSALSLTDFYDVDSLHSHEERMIQGSVREYVRSEILPQIGGWWLEGVFPTDLARRFGDLGALGVTLPERYGGAGASYTAYGLVCKEVEYVDSGLRSFVSVQSSLVMFPIGAYATDEIKEKWLPLLASGEAVGCFGLTEPDAGSDPGAMRTRCRKVGDEWVITGVKRWITSGSRADVAIVWAKDEDSGKVLGFVVETDRPGFEAVDIKTKASMRASVTSELYLDEVTVPAGNQLQVSGLKGPLSCLNQARFGIAFGVVGAAQACFDEATAYVSDRPAFGEPLAAKQLVQSRLADMLSEITKANLLSYRLGRLKEEGKDHPSRVSLAKRDNCRSALGVARAARDMLGGNGITTEYAAIRHMLNLETVATYEGTDAVHTLVLGREITGINAF
ncbi:MAG: acyl-CoA dehydrogenase family protein [Trueperaceae bacterium]|jgi:glutaryl-CoA dehydrogenase|nr:acyl-CoA dehydrogenase family protein [Trueperaceae bacterium]HRQ09843.1 acyl-CoA dehydrogenase family protein [Trueperaceae bacterium]